MGGPPGAGPSDANTTDPLAAMMSMFSGPGGPLGEMLGGLGNAEGGGGLPPALKSLGLASSGAGDVPGMVPATQPPPGPQGPKPFLVRCLPLLHIIATVTLCLWFVIFAEPAAYAVARVEELGSSSSSLWGRWAILAKRESESFGVHPMVSSALGRNVVLHQQVLTLCVALHPRIYHVTDSVTLPIRFLRPNRL